MESREANEYIMTTLRSGDAPTGLAEDEAMEAEDKVTEAEEEVTETEDKAMETEAEAAAADPECMNSEKSDEASEWDDFDFLGDSPFPRWG